MGFPSIGLSAQQEVRIGFLSALTGLETILGEVQLNCFNLAVEQINENGGIGGRKVRSFIEDNQTSTKGTIEKTRKLLGSDKVDTIIGMISSLEHVAARSVTSRAKKLLMYTCYYEGGVCEPYFYSFGQVPNQQIDPMSEWVVNNVGKSIYVFGSDYIWPRRSTEVLRAAFEARGGKVVGAEFVPFGTQDFGPILGRIRAAKPDAVWCMVAGADQLTALQQYRSFGLTPQVVSNGLDEAFSFANPALTEGAIANQAYFMGVDTPENDTFRKAYASRFGESTPINAIGEATYDAVWMYARAVEKAGTTDVEAVRKALREVDFQAPQGHIDFSKTNNCLRTNSLIARGTADGHWDIIENVGQIDPEVENCTISL